jgi:plasmid stability protein
MRSLQVREVPEYLYNKLLEEARMKHRSLAQEALSVLDRGLGSAQGNRARRQKLVQTIRELPKPPALVLSVNPVDSVREDRQR